MLKLFLKKDRNICPRSKGNQAMKFGQLMKYNRNIFL